MQISFAKPGEELMKQITAYVKEYELDDEKLLAEEFVAALHNTELVGFARLRRHKECDELCTLGVVKRYRGKGIGKALVEEIKKNTSVTLYVVCIIPVFFHKLGFTIVNKNIPDSIKRKQERCTEEYVVEEEYCVMQLQNKIA